MRTLNRRDFVLAGASCLTAAAIPATAAAPGSAFSFHYDHVLGTSLDLWLVASNRAAEAGERAALAEVERLRRVFSLYDPESELSRLNQTAGPVPASPELREVLRHYERWQPATGYACNALVGSLMEVWAQAERAGRPPDSELLASLAGETARPGWVIDDVAGTVARTTRHPLNLNSVAKGYILARVAAAVRSTVSGGLVNLGGDMAAFGETAWAVGVQNPFAPAENAEPLGGLRLRNAAVATSGGYQRFATVAGVRRSHLIDPRTGQPADAVASATVVAADSVTANVLASTLCVLGEEAGLRLVAGVPGAACYLVSAGGRHAAGPNFNLAPVRRADDKKPPAEKPKADAWPAGFQVTVALELSKFDAPGRYRRPYVAVWAEDAEGKTVRTLSVWGNKSKYLKDLKDWWKIGKDDADLVKAVTRATRGPGKYELEWDGKDDKGTAVPQGTYTVRVEVHREHGAHLRQTDKIECKAEKANVKLKANDETGETVVEYGMKAKP